MQRLQRKTERGFLAEAQSRMHEWNALLDRIENTPHSPLRPQMVIRALSDLLAENAVITLDCGAAIVEAIVDPDEQPRMPSEVKV
jgi:pyruvate dehydrogenase (quinone)